ncbi:alpha/beta hydrolase family protein [Dyella telluris]|uniref:Alpha/beta fold hydrolase n=1 Tax=Dyella telluris TaxID=2763498 RepID=A0A7G8Q400_9GAMM|nr:alpha/beta fold hydrolase [Dyella telluris]QNK01508.1 alpha/beta fold hydrolase [Dyella telluris]
MKASLTSAGFAVCLLLCQSLAPAQAFGVGSADDAKAGVDGTSKSEGEPKASMETMQIASHGSLMNALVYVAAGAGPHPTVILLHGFPGNERNLDLAQDMRRAGWNVLYFNYRGSWGSPGSFSFSHGLDDVAAAVAYLRQPANASRLRTDPSRIVLVGHSMGGFMAVHGAAADPAIRGIAMISGADLAGELEQLQSHDSKAGAIKAMGASLAEDGMAPLSGCTPDGLAKELSDHVSAWRFGAKVGEIKDRPVFVVTSDDGLAAVDDAFASALRQAGDTRVTTLHLATDHAYSDQRTELSRAVLQWLETIK